MEALKKIAQQNLSTTTSSVGMPPAAPAQEPYYARSASSQQISAAQQQPPPLPVTQSQPSFPFAAAPPPPVNTAMPYTYSPQVPAQGQNPVFPVTASSQPSGFPGVASVQPPVKGVDPAAAAQVQLIQILAQQGVPAEQIPAVLAALQGGFPASQPSHIAPQPPGQLPYSNSWGQDGARPDNSHERQDFGGRSPNRYNNRSRSRSPARQWGSRDSPRGRSDRGFGGYNRDTPDRTRDERSNWGTDYRQRSPPGRRGRSPTPPRFDQPVPSQKWIEHDRSLPSGHIKGMPRRK